MKHFNIVIEGVDGTGKSFLADRLRLELPHARLIRTSEGKPRNRQEQLLSFAKLRGDASLEGINIFDRHCAISESVYQDNGIVTLQQVQQELNDGKIDLLIWARRPANKCLMRVRKNDPIDVEYNKTLAPRIPQIIERYDALMSVLMDYMLYNGKHFELYNCDWDDPLEFNLFMRKITIMIELSK